MSSPNHPTSNIEDAFSSNFLYFILTSSDYVPTSSGQKTYSSSFDSFGVVPIASPSHSLFHNDPYMKVLQAFYAKELPIPPSNPITPANYYHLRSKSIPHLLPQLRYLIHLESKSVSYFLNSSTPPKKFEIGESSHMTLLEHQEEQVKDIQVRHQSKMMNLLEPTS
nr:hypothetical protein [Tanacetum cinerariifolium]